MAILAALLGILAAYLDIFFTALWAAALRPSFLVIGLIVFLAKSEARSGLFFAISAALSADLMARSGYFGSRLVGYLLLYFAARYLADSFFTLHRPGAAAGLSFLMSLAGKIAVIFYSYFFIWWAGHDTAALFGWAYFVSAFAASLLTALVASLILFIIGRFDKLTRRFFLIRR